MPAAGVAEDGAAVPASGPARRPAAPVELRLARRHRVAAPSCWSRRASTGRCRGASLARRPSSPMTARWRCGCRRRRSAGRRRRAAPPAGVMSATSSCSTMNPSGRLHVGEVLGEVDQHAARRRSRASCRPSVSSDQRGGGAAPPRPARLAVSSGGSPSASGRPAGSSQRCGLGGMAGTAGAARPAPRRRGDHRDRTGVGDDLTHAVPAAGHRDGVRAQGDDPALVDRLAGDSTTRYSFGADRAIRCRPSRRRSDRRAPAAARTPGSRPRPGRTRRTAGAGGSGGS